MADANGTGDSATVNIAGVVDVQATGHGDSVAGIGAISAIARHSSTSASHAKVHIGQVSIDATGKTASASLGSLQSVAKDS
ncbi:hypothetical protein G6677_09315, partial [Polynucleobacter paneuropaeus]|nr:hypothetical protein [Polynucleobacter paneuropaeus]